MQLKTRKQTGFTLIELLVVISIIGLLSSIILVSINSTRNKARYSKVLGDMVQITKAAELYINHPGNGYPADVGPATLPAALASYIARWPVPPCSGWTYDWENWSSGNDIRITLRRANNSEVYHYCIHNPSSACPPDITTLANKAITCME